VNLLAPEAQSEIRPEFQSEIQPGRPDPARVRPNVFVVGDAKCGTTSLYRMLQLSRGMGTARTRKELHYFSTPELVRRVKGPGDDRIPRDIVHDEAAYLAEFAHLAPDLPHVADVSPSYLQNPPAAQRIHAFAPQARIVIMLREPAAKVFSQYVHLWAAGRETLPFEAAFERSAERRAAGFSTMFDYAGGGYYAAAVGRYFQIFGRERVQVVLFEEMFGPDDAARRQLERFLGIAFAPGAPPRINVSGRITSRLWGPLLDSGVLRAPAQRLLPLPLRSTLSQLVRGAVRTERPALAPGIQTLLRRRYAEDAARLEALLGRRTGWPRR
jgi:hypothetical protein